MQPETIMYSIIIVVMLFGILATGTYISFALFGTAIVALMFFGRGNMHHLLESVMFQSINSYTLAALPMFVLMGEILIMSNCSILLFRGIKKVLGPFPGGLLHTNIMACSIFSACSGSSTATTVAIGGVSIPELTKQGYARNITLGSICAGGTLGVLIPPSIMMLLYGSMTGNSIGKLFIAGILPGIMLAGLFMLYIALACLIHPEWTPGRSRFGGLSYLKEVVFSIKDVWPIFLLIGGIMGSIYGGFATPTEAGAVSVVIAFIIWVFVYKTFTVKLFIAAVKETVILNAILMFCIIAARSLGVALSLLNIPSQLSDSIAALDVSRYVIWAAVVLVYILLGCLVDGIDLLIITVPVFYPIMVAGLGFDPIWFGVTLIVLLEMSLITPPAGFNLLITHSISGGKDMMDTIKGSLPFVVVMLIAIIILTVFPGIATFLPNQM